MTRAGGLLLYGPPASGKSTITRILTAQDGRFHLFKRLKVGGRPRGDEYRMTEAKDLADLRTKGLVIWENQRYGAIYATDRPELSRMTQASQVPVVHVGQVEAVEALRQEPISWVTIALTCPREVAIQRIIARATGDTDERVAAWDKTPPLTTSDLTVDTGACPPTNAARLIRAAYFSTQ